MFISYCRGYFVILCHVKSFFFRLIASVISVGKCLILFALVQGIARRLVKAALHEAAKKREMRYGDLKKIDRGVRRHFHDDITVIVLFLDSSYLVTHSSCKGPLLSIRGGCGIHANVANY